MSQSPALPATRPPALDAGQYREIFDALVQGYCIFEMLVDPSGRYFDYRFLEINRTFERQTGLINAVGRTALELVPNLEPHWIETYGRVAETGESIRFVQGSEAMGRCFSVLATRVGAPERRLVALLFSDITEHRQDQDERRKAEEALRRSEQRFRTLADAAPAMLWVTEPDGRCSYLSRGWYEFTGQTEGEALGTGWLEAVHPSDRQRAREIFLGANARHEAFELEHRLRRHDGVYRWVIDAGRPTLGSDGAFAGYVGSVIDIHDRKVTEQRLDLAVTSGEVGLWYCDLPFDRLVWNAKVKEHFGLPPDAEVTIETFYERMFVEDREKTRQAIDASIATRTSYDTQYRTVGEDGRIRWIRAIGHTSYEGDHPVRFDGITVDITELMALRDSAEAASRAKDEFLAMLGHELRNPLAPILTALQLLKLRGIEAGEHERAIIERQVRHLVGLVDDLLDVSRITRGRVELRCDPVELADVVARAVEIASPLLEQQRHELTVEVPRGLVVSGDSGRLAQVVANLLTNAAKYTDAGGVVTVRGSGQSGHVELTVSDTGIGIEAAMLPRVFELFAQEHQSLARSQGGLGLGLAIVRSLVELHGGTVSARSGGKGQGAEFSIRLPRVPASLVPAVADLAIAVESPAEVLSNGTRVLVVDDNQDAARMLGTMLAAWGYDTHVVYDGPSAVTTALAVRPDIALVDIGLPVMDGYELARRLAGHAELGGMTLVAVTGYGQARDQCASKDAGFAAHLVKPVDLDALRDVLTALRG
jgi:PAS domain S-box-containing protein